MLRNVLFPLIRAILAPMARADDDAEPTVVRKELDMRGYQTEAAPRGPELALPTDMIAAGVESEDGSIWRQASGESWLPFLGPALEMRAVGIDTVAEILFGTVAHREALAEGLDIAPEHWHWSIPDPAAVGTDAAFDAALADLEQRMTALLAPT